MKTKQIFILAFILCFNTALLAQSDLTSIKIAVFKNGTGFFLKSGKVDAAQGSYILKDTPDALFGTIWVAGKGERMTCELLYAKVPFEHIYEVDLPVNTAGYSYTRNNQGTDNTNKVWHSIKLNNNTKMPWTTGTAMVVKQQGKIYKPISQNMMKYTPMKSDTYLKITVSPDISVKDNDKEVKRQDRVKKRSGYIL